MPARASKAKGRRLQNLLRDKLRTAIPGLEEDDIQSQTMGMTGEDIVLSPAARKKIPYSFECKNQEKLNIWSALEQTEKNCPEDRTPVLVFTRNHAPTYAVVPLEHFIERNLKS